MVFSNIWKIVVSACFTSIISFSAYGQATPPQPSPPAPVLDPKLEARLAAEKEARKECKTEICKVFSAKKGEPGTIACDTTKTWLSTDIGNHILAGKLGWPWGDAQCSAHIEIDREAIAKLVSVPEATVKLQKHTLKCLIDKKGGDGKEADSYVVKVSIAPEVTFKNGKATAVNLNTSDVEAPALLQGAIWSAKTLDSAFGVLSNSAVTHINNFMFQSCKEVGIEIAEPK